MNGRFNKALTWIIDIPIALLVGAIVIYALEPVFKAIALR